MHISRAKPAALPLSDQVYDVTIVGASFSGLVTGMAASKSNKVLFIEKRRRPGTPINTTGAVPINWLTKMGVYPPDECISGKLSGVELVAPNRESVVIKNPKPDGMVLYPDRYVYWLSERARDMGCEIKTSTVFHGVSDGHAAGNSGDGKISLSTSAGTIRTRYLVGADGAGANVGLSVGLGERPRDEDLHVGLEYTVRNNGIQDPEVYRIYLGHKVAPWGYAWSFPEGTEYLKVGLGIPKSLSVNAKSLVGKFLDSYPEFKTPVSKSNGGIIPTAPPLKTAVKGNVLLVGDAAHFCSPLHGGGIWFGMLSGHLAGVALAGHNPSLYDPMWKRQMGGVLSRHYKLKQVIYSMSDRNFNDLVRMGNTFVSARKSKVGTVGSARRVLLSDPGFILDMAWKWSRKGLAIDAIKRALVPGFKIA